MDAKHPNGDEQNKEPLPHPGELEARARADVASGFGGCLKSEGFSGYVFSQASLWKLLPPLGQTKQIKTKKQKQKQKTAENQSRQNLP